VVCRSYNNFPIRTIFHSNLHHLCTAITGKTPYHLYDETVLPFRSGEEFVVLYIHAGYQDQQGASEIWPGIRGRYSCEPYECERGTYESHSL